MEKKYFFVLFTISLLSISPQVFAQEELGTLIEQQKIIFEVGKHADVRIKHVVETGAWSENNPKMIEILPGEHSDLSVFDEDGYELSFSYDEETFEESKHIILNQKLGNYDLIVEYTLHDFLKFDKGLWVKELKYQHDVMVLFDDVDLIFVNSRPVDVSNANGINCVGCFMLLEFFNEEKFLKKEVTNDDEKFIIEFLSNGEISNVEFSNNKNLINFNVENKAQLTTLKIPLELLLNPYNVYWTEKEDKSLEQLDKIRKTEYSQNDTHVNLSFVTTMDGIVSIVGATNEEHQLKLEQIAKIKELENPTKMMEEQNQITSLPTKPTISGTELSFEDELSKGQASQTSQDNTIIYAIIGIIAAIIIGVVIKLKKN